MSSVPGLTAPHDELRLVLRPCLSLCADQSSLLIFIPSLVLSSYGSWCACVACVCCLHRPSFHIISLALRSFSRDGMIAVVICQFFFWNTAALVLPLHCGLLLSVCVCVEAKNSPLKADRAF